jgi:hypothetical protein
MLLNRRAVLFGLLGAATPAFVRAKDKLQMTVYKDPSCGCCGAWLEHVKKAGIDANVVEIRTIEAVKKRFGIPDALTSCHTAEIGGYVIEGHVPAVEILRALRERPDAKGLAVAGMPPNSPGMELRGAPEAQYDVVLFQKDNSFRTYARYRGGQQI